MDRELLLEIEQKAKHDGIATLPEVVGRLLDVVFGALAQAIPNRTPAASFGTTGVTTVGGRHPRTGRYFVSVFPYPGGYGAYHGGDGLVHGVTPQSMANFMSIEMSEHRYPVRFKHFALREDSGGAGLQRDAPRECGMGVGGGHFDEPMRAEGVTP